MKLVAVLILVLASASATAQVVPPPQVGYPTTNSPFRDVDARQELTVFGGQYFAGKDPAGAAPKSGPMAGLRYEIAVGGPAFLFARGARVFSERNIFDPTKDSAARARGSMTIPLYLVDAGLAVSLTGRKSYRRVMPIVAVGAGLASTLNRKAEEDPFRFGTTFALSLGGGLRIVPGGRLQFRVDGGTYLYQIRYPSQYFVPAADKTQLLPARQAKNFWKSNPSITLGASYLLFR